MHVLFKSVLERSRLVFIAHYHSMSVEIFLLPCHLQTPHHALSPFAADVRSPTDCSCRSHHFTAASRAPSACAVSRTAGGVLPPRSEGTCPGTCGWRRQLPTHDLPCHGPERCSPPAQRSPCLTERGWPRKALHLDAKAARDGGTNTFPGGDLAEASHS